MRWWCSAVEAPWDWTPRPYAGVWLLLAALALGYGFAWRHHRRVHGTEESDGRYMRRFAGGLVALWIASDWPVGTLAGGYLASVHMLQYMLYTLAAAPLLMLGTPQWMADAVLDRLRARRVWQVLSKPVIAVVVSNAVLIATHSPWAVDGMRSTQIGSFAMDMLWLAAGMVLWAPVINPIPSMGVTSAPGRIVYLFLAAAVMPMIPGAFITFSPNPLYATYELAPRVGLEPLDDQQLAGVIMKIGNLPVIWTVMGVIWFRWYEKEQARPAGRRRSVPSSGIDLSSRYPRPDGSGSDPEAPEEVTAAAMAGGGTPRDTRRPGDL